jgi:hypothetical protein
VQKVLEELSGRGRVLVDGRQVATADYTVTIKQGTLRADSLAGRGRIDGVPSGEGSLDVIEGAADLELASEWTLVLQDGQQLACVRKGRNVNVMGPHYFDVNLDQSRRLR